MTEFKEWGKIARLNGEIVEPCDCVFGAITKLNEEDNCADCNGRGFILTPAFAKFLKGER